MESIHIAAALRYRDPNDPRREIDLPERSFAGGYKLTFIGPPNQAGKLSIVPVSHAVDQSRIVIPFTREDFRVLFRIFSANPNGLKTVYPGNELAVLNIAPEGMADLRYRLEHPHKPVDGARQLCESPYPPG